MFSKYFRAGSTAEVESRLCVFKHKLREEFEKMEESHGKKGGEMRGGGNKKHHLDRVPSQCGIHILTLPSKPDLANSTFERGKEKRFADYKIQKKKKKKDFTN